MKNWQKIKQKFITLTKGKTEFFRGCEIRAYKIREMGDKGNEGEIKKEIQIKEELEERIPMQVAQEKQEPTKSVLDIFCPYCAGENFVKRGTRQKKQETIQLYLCKDCQRTFTPGRAKGKQYPLAIILDAISLYNLGYSLERSVEIVNRINQADKGDKADGRDKGNEERKGMGELSASSLANWLKQYQSLCPYSRMRSFGLKMYGPEEVIETATLAHRQLYRFRYHKAKTRLIIEEDFRHSRFWALKEFLELVPAECPHQYFQQGLRASEVPIRFSFKQMIVRPKENYATKLCELVLGSVQETKKRHDALQRFMLANDSVTVATEVPVYLRREDLAHMQSQLGFELYHKNTENTKALNKVQGKENQSIRSPEVSSPRDASVGQLLNVKMTTCVAAGEDTSGKREDTSGKRGKRTKTKKQKADKELLPLKLDDLPKLITGHIDFLQIRNGIIHILDYKARAAQEKPIEQLTLYALALSRLTGLRVYHFKCAWFDEKDYFEFYPLHAVYKPKKVQRRKKVVTKDGVYEVNQEERLIRLRPQVS